jgi:hypothetical protein
MHHAGAHVGGADRKPRCALVEKGEVDQLFKCLAQRLCRVLAGLIGAEVDMGAEECAGVRKKPEMPLVSVIHDASASPAPAQAGNAPQKFARSTRFQNPLELRQAVLRLVARDQRCVDGADRGADDPIPLVSRLMQRLLVGAECPAALQHGRQDPLCT